MPKPNYQAADYQAAALALLPTGPVWPRETGSVVAQAMGAVALTFARLGARAVALLDESPAGSSLVELLPEWESTEGLPDPCSGPDPTFALRQIHAKARLAYSGGQSAPYFIAYAAALGYAITINEFVPVFAGTLRAGQPLYGEGWAHAWQVNAASTTLGYFRAGVSRAGEPLRTGGNQVLVCELSKIKPAHTVLFFEFTGPMLPARWDVGTWDTTTWA